jgi:diguanylate cyclase (GGDEF)-like protein
MMHTDPQTDQNPAAPLQESATGPAALPQPPLALRQKAVAGGKWLSAADEIVEYLQRHETEKENWWRTTSAALALLKSASHMVERAKETIAEQEQRIQVLEDLVTTDELSGLMNRRGFFQAFGRELDRAARDTKHGRGGLLMLIDLDNFKAINDTYGHAAGDAALKLVGRTLGHDVRTMDVAARLGGDEFVLLFADTTRAASLERAQKLVWRLNHLSLVWFGAEIPIRASLGLREYKGGDKAEQVFGDADVSMYANKQSNKGSPVPHGSFMTTSQSPLNTHSQNDSQTSIRP